MNQTQQKREKIKTPEQEQRAEKFKEYSANIVAAIQEASPAFIEMAKNGQFTTFGIRCKTLVNIPTKGICMGTYNKTDHLTKSGDTKKTRYYLLDTVDKSQFTFWLQVEDGWTYHDEKNKKKYVCKLVDQGLVLLIEEGRYDL